MAISFDYISDVHLDSWLSPSKRRSANEVRKLCSTRFLKGMRGTPQNDTLVVAGDFSHSNELTVLFLAVLLESYYKNIVFVPGNHDMASRRDGDSFPSYVERLQDLRNRLNGLPGAHMLFGESVEIDGVTYGGTTGWYDYSYSMKRFGHSIEQGNLLFTNWWDFENIRAEDGGRIQNFLSVYNSEEEKMAKLCGVSQVMITHMGPVGDFIAPQYADSPYSGFFYFDGSPFLAPGNSPQVWVYGHTHTAGVFKKGDTDFLCNPFGYRGENTSSPGIVSYISGKEIRYDRKIP